MPLTEVIFTLVVIGLLMWAVNTFIPMQARIKQVLNIVVVVAVVIWLLYAFGVISELDKIKVG